MERLQHSSAHSKKDKDSLSTSHQSNVSGGSNKKWSFGRLFRKKKELVSDSSSEEDRKAGFVPAQKYSRSGGNASSKTKSKSKSNRGSKLIGAGFDHIVVNKSQAPGPYIDNEFFLPVETVSPNEPFYQNQQMQQQQQQQQQYLPHAAPPQPLYARSSNSLDRRSTRSGHLKSRSTQRLPHEQGGGVHSSSEEELISLNSSTFSKYRSDESIHSGGQANNGQSRRSRAARNERYYKRLSRDGEPSHGQVPVMYAPQPTQRWKTQPVPLSIFNGPPSNVQGHHPPSQPPPPTIHNNPTITSQRLRNSGSLQHVAPYVQWGQVQQTPKNLQNSVNDSKRSISYDSQIHLQNVNGRLQTKPLPPPPPPRDPLRRVNVGGHLQNSSSNELRPVSYAFDQNGLPVLPSTAGLGGRCVSDDKIWAGQTPHYQSAHSLNMPLTQQQLQQQQQQQQQQQHQQMPGSRRFITRADRDVQAGKKSLPNGVDFHYVADATPRSRKPIHMMEPQVNTAPSEPPSSGILRTTKSGLPTSPSKTAAADFWKRLDGDSQKRSGREVERASYPENNGSISNKPRSISSSRIGELRSYPIPMYSEVQKPNRKLRVSPKRAASENVVCGSLHIRESPDDNKSYVEIRRRNYSKSNSMPGQYQRRSGEIPTTPNKYEEYVAEKKEQHQKPLFNPPTPPQRKQTTLLQNAPPVYFPRKKPANLEEAINELEAIYRSLGLAEPPADLEPEPEPKPKPKPLEKKERIPTPVDFEKFALAHADDYDDEDSPTGEPDPIRDDVAYRNIKLANLQHKTVEKQPPFGIPVGLIVPSPQTDYLHVTPAEVEDNSMQAPDVVKDDMAVRTLRKDPPGPKDRFIYPSGSLLKKNRATRTQSANIYSLIQRDAAKPSGGDLYSYLELTKNIDRSGSMSDLHTAGSTTDVPGTLTLLRNLKEQDMQQQLNSAQSPKKVQIPFRHPSQGGAISQLPEKLSPSPKEEMQKLPVPLPRKSLTPEPTNASHQMEDVLNKIAKDAQESSVKLTKELQELRKEALITASRPKANAEEEKLEKDLQEIEAVSEAAKRCGKMLLDTLPDASENATAAPAPRKLHKEGKLIKAIDQVSEAANAVCEKILKDIVTTEPPVVVQEAVKVKNTTAAATANATAVAVAVAASDDENLVMPHLIKKLDPAQSEKIEAIAKRCMRQLSELADQPDYDNLMNATEMQSTAVACNSTTPHSGEPMAASNANTEICTVAEVEKRPSPVLAQPIEEIDQIMLECEAKAQAAAEAAKSSTISPSSSHLLASSGAEEKSAAPIAIAAAVAASSHPMTSSSSSSNAGPANAIGPISSTTISSFSSSSDCLAKSSSPSASRRQSSSITSFNPYSSSDYIKSPSSDYHALSTDPIKTFSTTSYEGPSSSATPNITTNSTFSCSPSPPLNLTPVSGRARNATTANTNTTTTTITTDTIVNADSDTNANTTATIIGESDLRKSEDRARSSSPSQYNSSEELAQIFGIEEQRQKQKQKQKMSKNISGNVDVDVDAEARDASPSASPSPSLSPSTSPSSSNHELYGMPDTAQLTNPHVVVACSECVYVENANNPACLNVVAPTQTATAANTAATTITNTNNAITIAITTTNSPTTNHVVSPNSCKLENIAALPRGEENQNREDSENLVDHQPSHNQQLQQNFSKLSANFNKIYASEVKIIVDNAPVDDEDQKMDEDEDGGGYGVGVGDRDRDSVSLTQFDSLGSIEETSSNPDSGNVSLTDFPLASPANACLQLQSACNSRFEVKNSIYVSEVSLGRKDEIESKEKKELSDRNGNVDGFPPLPTEEELLAGLKEDPKIDDLSQTFDLIDCSSSSFNEDYSTLLKDLGEELRNSGETTSNDVSLGSSGTPVRKRSIVYETPQLNMNISEVKVNYELNASIEIDDLKTAESIEPSPNVLTQISQCTKEVEKLNEVLNQMPRRRPLSDESSQQRPSAEEATAPELSLLPWQRQTVALYRNNHNNSHAGAGAGAGIDDGVGSDDEKPSTSGSVATTSLFGEVRPASGLTTLEHVLLACSVGLISSNDLFTLFLIIIGVITIISIVLF